jgi:hypothetical protein
MRLSSALNVAVGAAWGVVLCAGCSSSRSVPPVELDLDGANVVHSGSRLRLQRLVAADGAVEITGLLDTVLGAPCAFSPGEDGKFRCIPFFQGVEGSVMDDRALSLPAIDATTCAQTPKYAFASWGTCGPVVSETNTTAQDAPVPEATFVAGTEQHVGTGRLVARVVSGEDGSRIAIGWYDTDLDVPCSLMADAGSIVCVPSGVPTMDLFARADCTGPLSGVTFASAASSCAGAGRPKYALTLEGSLCAPPRQVFRIGAPMEQAFTIARMPGGGIYPPSSECDRVAGDAFAIGDDDLSASLARVPAPAGGGATRLVRTMDRRTVVWFDTARNETCTFQHASDGTIRCIPPATLHAWASADCSGTLGAARDVTTCDDALGYAIFPNDSISRCRGATVYALGKKQLSATTFSQSPSGAGCSAPPPDTGPVFELAKVDPTAFVQATLVTD